MGKFTHLDDRGRSRMVDVSEKPVTRRRAVASGSVKLTRAVAEAIRNNSIAKGNVLEIARIAGVQGAKQTSQLIPLCHPLPVTNIVVDLELQANRLHIRS